MRGIFIIYFGYKFICIFAIKNICSFCSFNNNQIFLLRDIK